MSIWRVEIQHGPEGEQNYAWVYDGKEMIGTFKTHRANQIVEAMNRRPEPSAPSPAGVEVVSSEPERLWLGAPDEDNESDVWFDAGEGGTEYVRADLAAASLDQATRRAEEAHRNFIEAWEGLPGGRQQSVRAVERWLADTMKPAVDRAREALSSTASSITEKETRDA